MVLSESDISGLAAFLHLSPHEFIQANTRLADNRAFLSLKEKADGSCIFLRDNRCAVYSVRPEQCRQFPLGWTVEGGCPKASG